MQGAILFCGIALAVINGCHVNAAENNKKRNIINPPRWSSFTPNRMAVCVDGICNKTLNYPYRHLRNLYMAKKLPKEYSGTAIKSYTDFFNDRFFDEDNVINMCEDKEYFMVPMAAKNVEHQWMFIVQIGDIKQQVYYDKCNSNVKCFAHEYIPDDYETSCMQHKIIIRLLALDEHGIAKPDEFVIPGGCACVYKRPF